MVTGVTFHLKNFINSIIYLSVRENSNQKIFRLWPGSTIG